MPNIAFLCNDILAHVTDSYIPKPNLPPVHNVDFISTFDPQEKNVVYIGPSRMIHDALTSTDGPIECTTFFTCDTSADLMDIARKRNVNVIVIDFDTFKAHAIITRAVRRYRDWRITLLETGNETQNAQSVLQAASNMCRCTLFLLNKSHQVISSAIRDEEHDDVLVQEMMLSSLLTEETFETITATEAANPKPYGTRLPNNGKFTYFKHDVYEHEELSYSVILVRSEPLPLLDGKTLLAMICDVIDAMTSGERTRFWAGEDFRSFIDTLSKNPSMGEEEIRQRLKGLPIVPEKYCSFIVIDFDSQTTMPDPIAYFVSQTEEIFPNCNACVYDNTVVLLYGRPERFHWRRGNVFDYDRFLTLLTQFRACASISTATSKLTSFPTEVDLARNVLRLGRKLRYKPEERIFFTDDYAEYLTLDLCYPEFIEHIGSGDLISLAHPDVVNLWRYDQANNDCLLDVAYYYCLCGPNIAKTAQMVFMHRNTVAAKLKKIESVVIDDITDGQVQQRIILSYRILRYLDLCTPTPLKQRIKPSPHKRKA